MKRLLSAMLLSISIAAPAWANDDLPSANKPAPMFRLPLYNPAVSNTGMLGLDQYIGPDATDKNTKVVLLSFMASFCGPCKKEMPYLQMLHNRYKDFGLRVVMVSIDTEPAGQKIVSDLIEKNKVTFPVLKDRFNLVARRWLGTQTPLPSVFMLRPDGTVSMVHRGYNEEASKLLVEHVEAALGMRRGPAAHSQPPATASAVP
jgi:thiol-disulfide isomerase/thioredoxin